MGAFRAHILAAAIFIGIGGLALGAGRKGVHVNLEISTLAREGRNREAGWMPLDRLRAIGQGAAWPQRIACGRRAGGSDTSPAPTTISQRA